MSENEDIARKSSWRFGNGCKSYDDMDEQEKEFALLLVEAVKKKMESERG